MKHSQRSLLFSLGVCILALALPVMADPYPADEIIPLPVPPNPEYTNTASGTLVFGSENPAYTVMVENELILQNWKEWIIQYTITPLNPEDWWFDPHVDYGFRVNPGEEPPLFDRCQMEAINPTTGQMQLYSAWWDTLVTGSGSAPPTTTVWTAAGFPFANQSAGLFVMSSPLGPIDYLIDTYPFDFNPEWVSLEFAGRNVQIDYVFYDWCVPEPTTVGLMLLGSAIIIRRRR